MAAMMCGRGGVSVCVGVCGGCLGVVLMSGRGSGVDTLCRQELFQEVVRR